MRFRSALVRQPGPEIVLGLLDSALPPPDPALALEQHGQYVQCLQEAGLQVYVLPADAKFPDGLFVEDTCILTEHGALLTQPGHPSRQGEVDAIGEALARIGVPILNRMQGPALMDGGDVLRIGNRFLVGLSDRTNAEGLAVLETTFSPLGFSVVPIAIDDALHLKSVCTSIGDETVFCTSELADHPALIGLERLVVPGEETYAINVLDLGTAVLISEGYPRVAAMAAETGKEVFLVPVSEFKKMNGSLTCLSLLIP